MPSFSTARFAAALKPLSAQLPEGLSEVATRRFAVYRNNVAVSLIRALESRFPAVLDLVGEEFFRAMAREFVSLHPPASAVMMEFGDAFPAFVDGFTPASAMPYLGDVARIEAARTRAYHAADLPRLEAGNFAAISPDRLGDLLVTLHPAVSVWRSPFPTYTIFAMSSGSLPAGPIADWMGQDVLVDRPEFDTIVRPLPVGAASFLMSLAEGMSLGEAADQGFRLAPAFDLTAALADLIGSRLATHISFAPQGSPS